MAQPRLRPDRIPPRYEEEVSTRVGPLRGAIGGGLADIGRRASGLLDTVAYNPVVQALGGMGDREGFFSAHRANKDRAQRDEALAAMFGDDPNMAALVSSYPDVALGEHLRRQSTADERSYQEGRTADERAYETGRDEREYGRDVDLLRTRARLEEEARRSALTREPFEVVINGQKRQIIRGAEGQLTDYVTGQPVDPASVSFGASSTQTSFGEPYRHPDLGYGQFDNEGQWHPIEVENNTDAGAMGDPAARLYTAGSSISMVNDALDTSGWQNTGLMARIRGGNTLLDTQIRMLQSNNAFLGLAELASQGVKLTPLSNADLKTAGDMVANLDTTQGTETLRTNLRQVGQRYLNTYQQILRGVRDQYPDGNVPPNVAAVVSAFEDNIATLQDRAGFGQADQTGSQDMPRFATDDEVDAAWDSMPRGAQFIGPDGQTYRKP